VRRRAELPAELLVPYDAFLAVLEELEPAKAAVVDAVPGARLPGRPWRDAVTEYRDRLDRSTALMPGWRCPPLDEAWEACDHGVDVALERARRLLAAEEDPTGFEGLLGTVERLLDPLEPFAAAEARFRSLRRRPSPRVPMLTRWTRSD
jgi:hypothetical protein